MNKRNLQLTIIAIAVIVSLTSCNRQNLPEFASGRFHHKEKTNKQIDEATLALRQRDKIEPIATKAPEQLQAINSNEELHSISANKNGLTHSSGRKAGKSNVKHLMDLRTLSNEAILKTDYAKNSTEPFNSSANKFQMGSHNADRALCAVIAIFIPFLGVGLWEGLDVNFWIDLLLTFLFYFPGLIFALIVILSD